MHDDLIDWMRKCIKSLRGGDASKLRIKAGDIGFWRAYLDHGYYTTRDAPVIFDFTELKGRTMPVISQRILVDVEEDFDKVVDEIVVPWVSKFSVEDKLELVWTT